MEIHPGVFVSSVTTDDWRPDPEVGGEMHVVVEDATAYAGMSRFLSGSDPARWTLPERETVLVLEGQARVEIEGGPTLVLRVGDLASLPSGAVTTWHLTRPFRELWFFGRPYEAGLAAGAAEGARGTAPVAPQGDSADQTSTGTG